MTKIDGPTTTSPIREHLQGQGAEKSEDRDKGGFRSTLASVAGGVGSVASAIPGGQALGMVARGVSSLAGGSSSPMPGAQDDQIHQMFEMQKQSQAFNLQYLELQNKVQEDNRQFSTLSNLMKVRHDTAKAAINNMHA